MVAAKQLDVLTLAVSHGVFILRLSEHLSVMVARPHSQPLPKGPATLRLSRKPYVQSPREGRTFG